ncbi:hypothetical protein [Streptomyces phaeochromogenes]
MHGRGGVAKAGPRTLLESGAWDTLIVGGEEADIDLFYQTDAPVYVPRPDPRDSVPAHVPQEAMFLSPHNSGEIVGSS